MIIAEDPRVTSALELRERGNAEPIQVLLRDGFLNRKSSLDVLGDPTDISLDFLTVTAGLSSSVNSDTSLHEDFDIEFHLQEYEGKDAPSVRFFVLGAFSLTSRSSTTASSSHISDRLAGSTSLRASHSLTPCSLLRT